MSRRFDPGAAAPATETSRTSATPALDPIAIEDLLALQWIADPRLSPDGRRIAFTRVWIDREADAYRTRVQVVDAAGGEPRDLTSGSLDSQPRWSPDGRFLAFVRGEEGKDKDAHVYVLPMGGGESRKLTELKGGGSDPAWSPDGKRLAFRSGHNPALDREEKPKPKNEPCRVVTRPVFRWDGASFTDFDHLKHVWVVDAEGGTPRQITTGRAFEEDLLRWSPDGRRLMFVSDRREEPWFGGEHSDLWAVSPELETPTDGAGLEKVVEFTGPVRQWAMDDAGRIAIIGFLQPDSYRTYDRPSLLIAEGPWPAKVRDVGAAHDFDFGEAIGSDQHPPRGGGETPLAFTDGGRVVITVVGRHGASQLTRVNLADGHVEALTDGSHEVLHGSANATGTSWALTVGDAMTPLELHSFDAGSKKLLRICGANDALLASHRAAAIEEFWYESFDGRRIQGWIAKPPGFDPKKKYPLILEIHGGPHAAYGQSFYHEFHALAGAGYVVLFTNPRGSTTYGQEFGDVIQYRYPGDDYHDLMAGVDAVIARGYVDESRLGVTGGSGGGLLTNWVITKTQRFKAAVTQRCVADWASMWASSDFALFTPSWFRKPPFEDPTEYLERSPASYASSIDTPLMVIHSEDDWRTPIGQGEAMFRALIQQRKTAVMVRFPAECHELSRSGMPSRRIQRLEHIRKWFDRYLLGKDAPEYGA
ncbi:MAG: S9 family peptidase [Candidatus Eisenbacteria bacterium]|nr:S9 family peptidase [Candidatus Eisenbacteria bacterium]